MECGGLNPGCAHCQVLTRYCDEHASVSAVLAACPTEPGWDPLVGHPSPWLQVTFQAFSTVTHRYGPCHCLGLSPARHPSVVGDGWAGEALMFATMRLSIRAAHSAVCETLLPASHWNQEGTLSPVLKLQLLLPAAYQKCTIQEI